MRPGGLPGRNDGELTIDFIKGRLSHADLFPIAGFTAPASDRGLTLLRDTLGRTAGGVLRLDGAVWPGATACVATLPPLAEALRAARAER